MSRASGKLRQSIAALAVVAAGSLMTASIAHAAELRVLSPQAMRPALNDLVPQFERSSGIQVTIFYATASALVKEIEDGKMADLAILSPEQIERLQEEDKIVEDSLISARKARIWRDHSERRHKARREHGSRTEADVDEHEIDCFG